MARNNKHRFEKGDWYHIYNKVVSGEKLFNEARDYHDFLKRYDKYFGSYFDTFAYCLLPNHFHFLVGMKTPDKEIMVK